MALDVPKCTKTIFLGLNVYAILTRKYRFRYVQFKIISSFYLSFLILLKSVALWVTCKLVISLFLCFLPMRARFAGRASFLFLFFLFLCLLNAEFIAQRCLELYVIFLLGLLQTAEKMCF